MRLLVAEDEPMLAAQLKAALEKSGYVIDVAADGLDAEHQGLSEPYDLAVLDLGLPGRDGLSVLRAWREAGRTMPVLILTARDNWHDKVPIKPDKCTSEMHQLQAKGVNAKSLTPHNLI